MDTPVTIGPISLPAGVLAAIIAAIASIVVAAVSYMSTMRNTRKTNQLAEDLEKFKSSLEEEQAEKKARRDYQYEARKHLYQQYEPLLFQLVERCETAKNRVYSLARTARKGNLGPAGWLSTEGNYLRSTIYYLLSPLVIFKLMQRSLTIVDLTVDPFINDQYLLAKQLAWTFTDAFIFAEVAPQIDYDPYFASARLQQELNPEKYWRQGISAGALDKALEACIKRDPDGVSRCMTFSEFEEEGTYPKFDYISTIFLNFHPKTRPVLWRILITQVQIHEALLSSRQIKIATLDEKSTPKLAIKPLTKDARLKLNWRQSPAEATDEEVLVQPFEVARKYLGMENSFVRHLVEK